MSAIPVVGEPFAIFVVVYFLVVNSFYAVLLFAAILEIRFNSLRDRNVQFWRISGSEMSPRISLIAPAFNEEATIGDSVKSLITLNYRQLEVVVVNDGSSDATLDTLHESFDLESVRPVYRSQLATAEIRGIYRSRLSPGLIVVDKENGGKADALNAGLNIATNDLVCAIDADTLIEPDALQKLVRPFVMTDGVVATGGTIRPANACEVRNGRVEAAHVSGKLIPGIQVVEYLRAFLFGRLGWNRVGGNLIVSGAFGLFRKSAVIEAGGYRADTVGEDIELVCRMRRLDVERGLPGLVVFVPDPVAWTEVPSSAGSLGRQRDRWHRGLADTLWRHRRMFMNPRYKSLGLVVMPYFVLVELLAPVIEVIGLIGLVADIGFNRFDAMFAFTFFMAAYGYGVLLGVATIAIEHFYQFRFPRASDRLRLIFWTIVESVGYRQMTVYWRLRGLFKYLAGDRNWGAMKREGFGTDGDSREASK